MERKIIATDQAPAAIGPYSQAVVANGFVFTAGQIPIIPATGALVDGGVDLQTERVLENIKALLDAAGSSLERVVKTTVFLAEMADFAAMNDVYARYFGTAAPARSTVAVKDLPRGVAVEIEAVALAGR
jgi:2-iminobutanoate/2-iminopropanoate deaminase